MIVCLICHIFMTGAGKQLTGLIIKHSTLSNVIINLETEGRNYVKVRVRTRLCYMLMRHRKARL